MTRARSIGLLLIALLATGVALDPQPVHGQTAGGVTVSTAGGDVTVLADQLEQIGADNLLIATGNVEITKGTARLVADRVEINRATGVAVAEGRVIFYDGDDRVTGTRIEYNLKSGTGVIYQGDARTRPFYRIVGERLDRVADSQYRVRRGIFTTCEDDPPTWSFHFGQASADLEESIFGTAGSFWVKNVPVIPFLPFFAAALRRERQTGFLFPRLGSSSDKGFFYEQPFFWAISDSQDATLTLSAFEKVGVGGSAEYRYILSQANRGTAHLFFIRETREQLHGQGHDENRGVFGVKHDWALGGGFTLRADVNHVTDDRMFREFGDAVSQRAAQRLESNVFVTRSWLTANLVGNLFWYQDLTTPRPVELNRLPDVRFQAPRQPVPGLPGFLFELESSGVRFVREVGSEGTRVDLHPRLSRPVPVFGFFTVTPFVGGRLTGYDRTVTGQTLNFDQTVVIEQTGGEPRLRRLAELGTDLESRAVRVYDLGGLGGVDAVLHSIEPRVNYTWIDGTNLDRLPQWTGGIDDIAPTSLLTYSLINRVRARTLTLAGTEPFRWELLRFTLSNTYDLHAERRPFGLIGADLIVDPNRVLLFRASAALNAYGEGVQGITTDLAVRVPPKSEGPLATSPFIASLGTRYDRPGNVEFLQGNLTAELTQWAAARFTTNWDLRTDTFVENRYALDLKWQCWALTTEFVTRVKDVVLSRTSQEFRFTLHLLGLGSPLGANVGLGALTGTQAGGAVK